MTDGQPGPGAGRIIAGVVLIFFGLCILLVGGGCTLVWIALLFDQRMGSGRDGWGMMLISVIAAGAGLFAIIKGVQMFRRRRD